MEIYSIHQYGCHITQWRYQIHLRRLPYKPENSHSLNIFGANSRLWCIQKINK